MAPLPFKQSPAPNSGVFVLVFVAVAGSQFIADQLRGTIPDILYIVMCLSASVLATLALLTSSQWLPHVPMPFIVACIFANQLWFHIRQRVFVKELGYSNLTNVWTLSVVLFFMEVLRDGGCSCGWRRRVREQDPQQSSTNSAPSPSLFPSPRPSGPWRPHYKAQKFPLPEPCRSTVLKQRKDGEMGGTIGEDESFLEN